MELSIGEFGTLILRDVYESICLQTELEEFVICMREDGFEFRYMDQWYTAVSGKVTKVGPTSVEI